MNLTPLLIFLHITTMFAAITVGFGSGFLMRIAYMTGQVAAVRGLGMVSARVGPLIPILFITGGIFGLLTAISFGLNLLAPWLVIAYVLFAIAMYIGAVENRKWGEQMGQLLRTAPDGPVTPEIAAMFDDPRVRLLTIVDYAIVVVIIFDMVVKPFS
jgi:hypothetical protein